jgi:hypothetical protein
MPAIFDFLYQEYCRARLAEMRKQLLLLQQNVEIIPDVDPVDRDSLSDDRSAGQHDARAH